MKKTACIALALLLLFTQVIFAFGATAVKGDVDGDGDVTAADARLALRQSVSLERLSPRQRAAAAVTGSSEITAADARIVLRIAVGLTTYDAEETAAVENKLAAMTLQEKIEQMLLPDVRNFDGEGVETLNDSLTAMLNRHAFAGVILFAPNTQNAEQTLRLTHALQTANRREDRPQLFIAIDQEGGKVTRLATGTQTPGNMALGAVGDEATAEEAAGIIGEELSSLGINVDFAPVMDVNNEPSNSSTGVRSFSDDPALAAKLGASYVRGLQNQNVISTLKHFPGHGDTGTDSHTGLPRIEKSYAALQKNELIPFAAGIAEGAEMIMTAHIQFPEIETETYRSVSTGRAVELPATLSKTIITDVLRGDMGFDGVVTTDALNMDAIAEHFDPLDAAALAVNAGIDILLMPFSTHSDALLAEADDYIDRLVALARDGEISTAKIDDAVRRILRLKYRKGLFSAYEQPDLAAALAAAQATVGSKAHHEAEWTMAKNAVTMVKNANGTLPIRAAGKKIALLSAYPNETASMQYGVARLRDEGKLPANAEFLFDCYAETPIDVVLDEIDDADYVIAISELYRTGALNPWNESGAAYANLDRIIKRVHANGGRFVQISANLPYDVARVQAADAILLCWSDKGMSEDPRIAGGEVTQYGPNIPAAVYLALSPDEGPKGKLPVRIPALDGDYTYSDEILYPFGFGLQYE